MVSAGGRRADTSWRSTRAPPRRAPSCSTGSVGRSPRRSARSPSTCPRRVTWSTMPRRSGRPSWPSPARSSATAGLGPADIAAIGITNQRETTIVWDRATGVPVAPAIVWQSRITAARCEALRAAGHESRVRTLTGLPLDAYFSGPKIAHILDSTPGLRARADAGELAFGTVDSWLVWRLTGGRVHATDVSNASRTLLFDITTLAWDPWLCAHDGRAAAAAADRGQLQRPGGARPTPRWFGGAIPIAGIAGDQQAATFGQACFAPGSAQEHLRHGRLPAAQHRRPRRSSSGARAADDGALAAGRRWPAELRPGGLRVRGRRSGPVAARRAAGHRLRRGRGTPRRERVTRRTASTWCRRSPGSARRGGTRRRAACSSASRGARASRTSRGRPSTPSPTRSPTSCDSHDR